MSHGCPPRIDCSLAPTSSRVLLSLGVPKMHAATSQGRSLYGTLGVATRVHSMEITQGHLCQLGVVYVDCYVTDSARVCAGEPI